MAQWLGDDFSWNRPLSRRRGGPTRLGGLQLYYDFNWDDIFPDGRAQFRNGQCLAELVRADCPINKIPALLLTTQDDVEEGPIETDSHFVVVLNLPRYLASATADAAASYYAHSVGSGITGLAHLHDLAARPDVIDAVVDHALDVEHIAAWASSHEDRIEQLRRIAGVVEDPDRVTADLAKGIGALNVLENLDADVIHAIEGLLGQDLDREARLRFLRALTADPTGRSLTSDVLGERIADRLRDARAIADAYSALLKDPHSGETDLQQFVEKSPWLLGLDYISVRARRALPRGEMDFILERYDGFYDLLELKDPHDPIIEAVDEADGVPPPASAYGLSRSLSQALAQVQVYRETLMTGGEVLDTLYGLRGTREPRVIIVIGQGKSLPAHRASVLRGINRTLHRMEIVPYDVLADRMRTILDNIERHLLVPESDESRRVA